MRGGVTRNLWNGAELTIDGSFRQKHTQSGFFAPFNTLFVVPNDPVAYVASELTTAAVTPRLNIDQTFDAVRLRMIAGADVYKTKYLSDRSLTAGAAPNHVYDIDQLTAAAYAQPTLTFWRNTDVSVGGRVQRNSIQRGIRSIRTRRGRCFPFRRAGPWTPMKYCMPRMPALSTGSVRHSRYSDGWRRLPAAECRRACRRGASRRSDEFQPAHPAFARL